MVHICQILQGEQSFCIVIRGPQGLFLHQKNLEVNRSQPRRLTCASKFNTIRVLFWEDKRTLVFLQLTFKLWCLGNLSRGVQLFLSDSFPCNAEGKARGKDSLLQLGIYTSLGRNCWDTLSSNATLHLFEDTINSLNCLKLTGNTAQVLLHSSKLEQISSIFLCLILLCSIMKQ